jgi:hypothetical protein
MNEEMDAIQAGEELLDKLNPEMLQGSAPPEPAEGLAGPLADIDPEKLAALEDRLKEFRKNAGQTESGSEAVDAAISTFNPADWEVEPELEHLYQRSQLENTDQGPKWTVLEHQYWIVTGKWHVDHSGEPKTQNGRIVKDKHGRVQRYPKGIDHMVQEIINGPDGMLSREKGWRLSALLPGAMGEGIAVLERQARRALPDPKAIVKPEETPLEKVTDEELVRMNERAQEWTEENSAPTDGLEPIIEPTTEEGQVTEEGGQ